MENTKHWTEDNFQLNLKEPKNFASGGGHTGYGAKVHISNLEKNNGKLKVIFKAYFNFISHFQYILRDYCFKNDKQVEIKTSGTNDLIFQNENFLINVDSAYNNIIKDNEGKSIKDSNGSPCFNDKQFGTIEIDGLNELNSNLNLNKRKEVLNNEIKNLESGEDLLESKKYQLNKLTLTLKFLYGLEMTIKEKLGEYKNNELEFNDVNNKYVYIASGLLNDKLQNAL